MTEPLQFSCALKMNVIRVNSELDDFGCIKIEISDYVDRMKAAIDKQRAEAIVNHLITVFDITPEQRNK